MAVVSIRLTDSTANRLRLTGSAEHKAPLNSPNQYIASREPCRADAKRWGAWEKQSSGTRKAVLEAGIEPTRAQVATGIDICGSLNPRITSREDFRLRIHEGNKTYKLLPIPLHRNKDYREPTRRRSGATPISFPNRDSFEARPRVAANIPPSVQIDDEELPSTTQKAWRAETYDAPIEGQVKCDKHDTPQHQPSCTLPERYRRDH